MSKLTLTYRLLSSGAAEAVISDERSSAVLTASFLSDALGDLADATAALMQGVERLGRRRCIIVSKGGTEMADDLEPIDISAMLELAQLADEVHRTQQPRMLRRDGQDLAVLSPVMPAPTRRAKARPLTEDDSLFALVGIGDSGIPGGLSERKHEMLGRLRHT